MKEIKTKGTSPEPKPSKGPSRKEFLRKVGLFLGGAATYAFMNQIEETLRTFSNAVETLTGPQKELVIKIGNPQETSAEETKRKTETSETQESKKGNSSKNQESENQEPKVENSEIDSKKIETAELYRNFVSLFLVGSLPKEQENEKEITLEESSINPVRFFPQNQEAIDLLNKIIARVREKELEELADWLDGFKTKAVEPDNITDEELKTRSDKLYDFLKDIWGERVKLYYQEGEKGKKELTPERFIKIYFSSNEANLGKEEEVAENFSSPRYTPDKGVINQPPSVRGSGGVNTITTSPQKGETSVPPASSNVSNEEFIENVTQALNKALSNTGVKVSQDLVRKVAENLGDVNPQTLQQAALEEVAKRCGVNLFSLLGGGTPPCGYGIVLK